MIYKEPVKFSIVLDPVLISLTRSRRVISTWITVRVSLTIQYVNLRLSFEHNYLYLGAICFGQNSAIIC